MTRTTTTMTECKLNATTTCVFFILTASSADNDDDNETNVGSRRQCHDNSTPLGSARRQQFAISVSCRTDLDDDSVDVTSFSALGVVEESIATVAAKIVGVTYCRWSCPVLDVAVSSGRRRRRLHLLRRHSPTAWISRQRSQSFPRTRQRRKHCICF